ncbi:coproporphyrinogen dehydrogenase HemZ [Acetivibrio straminisolvens]|jgi:oxygen-independent coproporphyrinogen-3 oxidase|uniref:coproporphyrinogen dehydrogenase HemZ n=1 Tax=Acetivibrio straminisolvens TaxID=253314 RepID=UPI002240CD7D|nr:coproporphyrinogen dehydrogenase HemZ [Acetivibrio straminisolvens]
MEIYIKLEGHEYRYEIENILKLFFDNGSTEIFYRDPGDDYRGILLYSRLKTPSGNDGQYRVETIICVDGKDVLKDNHFFSVSLSKKDANYVYEERKIRKREVKRQVYKALSQFTGKNMPWGMLTGIRPAKIVHELMDMGCSKEEINSTLKQYYFVSGKKSKILYDVAKKERHILDASERDMVGIYIGIPFCTTRCLYCSFTSNPVKKYEHMVESYIQALKKEIFSVGSILCKKRLRIESIYIGGGTPTSVDALYLKELLMYIEEILDLKDLKEYTLEAGRPDSITCQKLEIIKKSKVGRISINPQTMNDEILRKIGRLHTSKDIVDAFELARSIGFDNINMDVIAGLPGSNLEDFVKTIGEIGALGPESVTVHTMAIKRASRLNEDKEHYSLASGNEVSQMVDAAYDILTKMGLEPYYLYRQKNMLGNLENIGYSKAGYESIYNVQIMEEKQSIIALGAGAITKVVFPENNRIERAFNVKNVEEYIARIDEMITRKNTLLSTYEL